MSRTGLCTRADVIKEQQSAPLSTTILSETTLDAVRGTLQAIARWTDGVRPSYRPEYSRAWSFTTRTAFCTATLSRRTCSLRGLAASSWPTLLDSTQAYKVKNFSFFKFCEQCVFTALLTCDRFH